MRGYGDSESGGLGYGDPESLAGTVLERGYGSPTQEALIYLTLQTQEAHHRGGQKLEFTGPLSDNLSPYRISMIVNGQRIYLYSGTAGDGPDLRKRQGDLEGYSPPAPKGSYNLTLHYGPNFGTTYNISPALTIKPDSRGNARYIARRSPPHFYQTGARSSAQDVLDLATVKPERPPYLHMILDAFGRLTQEHTGHAQTVLARDHALGESVLEVETTLTFKGSGHLYIDDEKYSYIISGSNIQITPALRASQPALSEVISDN